jgi:hypothetical protein
MTHNASAEALRTERYERSWLAPGLIGTAQLVASVGVLAVACLGTRARPTSTA